MAKGIVCLFGVLLLALVLSGCVFDPTQIFYSQASSPKEPELDSSQLLHGLSCDALSPCPEGFKCAFFQTMDAPACFPASKDPCEILSCPAAAACAVAESFPLQVFCS